MDLRIRGGFGVREGALEKGQSTVTHQHNFDHITYCLGPMRVEQLASEDGPVVRSVDKPAGGWVLILAGTWHRLTALEDATYHCLYVHRTPDGQVSDQYDGWMPAYE